MSVGLATIIGAITELFVVGLLTTQRLEALKAAAAEGEQAVWDLIERIKAEGKTIDQQWDDAGSADRPG